MEKSPPPLEVVKENTVSTERVSSSKPSSVGPGEMPAASKSILKPTGSNKVTKIDADDDGTSSTGTSNQASIRSRHETICLLLGNIGKKLNLILLDPAS